MGKLLRLTSTNIFTNLAAEERLFQRGVNKSLLFYVNSECAVLGRTQNPFKEVDVAYAARHGIPIARRRSGGGTVVHDEGNLNFCFVRPRSEHEPLSNAKFVAGVLREDFGIKATVNERADILVEGMKVSGAAYRISRDRAYHHGTLLINSDLDRLRRLLKSPQSNGIQAMGTASIRSPVTNLCDHYSGSIDATTVVDAIADRFVRTNATVTPLSPTHVERTYGGMQSERGEVCSHAWIYGKTPRFTYDLQVDDFILRFEVDKGAVVSRVRADANGMQSGTKEHKDFATFLTHRCAGRAFDGRALSERIRNDTSDAIGRSSRDTLAAVLEAKIPWQFYRVDGEHPRQAMN